MKKHAIIIFCLIILLFTGCSQIGLLDSNDINNTNLQDYPVTVEGVEFLGPPETVVSLSPTVTEILFEIGIGDKIVGRSNYCSYPDGVANIPAVGSPAMPDIQAILDLKPELVITQSPVASIDINELKENGIKILEISPPKNFYEINDIYAMLAMVFLGNKQSDKITEEKIEPLDDALYQAQSKGYEYKYLCITNKFAVATGDTLAGSLLNVFGINVAEDYTDFSMPAAEIAAQAPNLIFISKDVDKSQLDGSVASLLEVDGVTVITIDYTFFEKPTSRLNEVISEIDSQLVAPVEQVTSASE